MYQYRISNDAVNSQSAEGSGCGCNNSCDSNSARALKRILSQVDELNSQDLNILEDVVGRLLCSRS